MPATELQDSYDPDSLTESEQIPLQGVYPILLQAVPGFRGKKIRNA